MCSWVKRIAVAALAGAAVFTSAAADRNAAYGFGTPVTQAELKPWDIDVRPDGAGLPPGRGTAEQGESIYVQKCASCHGDFGEGVGRFPALVGTRASLIGNSPSKTVGGYWPYATTLWDYINRAMPFGNAQSLTPNEVYAITAYILSSNNIIGMDEEMTPKTLPRVKMPNRDGFIVARGTDIHVKACMHDCVKQVTVTSRASNSAVSRQGE